MTISARITNLIKQPATLAQHWCAVDAALDDATVIKVPERTEIIGDGVVALQCIVVTRNFDSVEVAFTTLFKQYVFLHEEWSVHQELQDSSKWEKSLSDVWIPEYITSPITPLSSEAFLKKLVLISSDSNFYKPLFSVLQDMNVYNLVSFMDNDFAFGSFGYSENHSFILSVYLGH